MALRKQTNFDQYDYQNQAAPIEEKSLRYQEYHAETDNAPKLSELLFFVNIAAFCILTIIFSFIFLSFKIQTFFSVALAVAMSLATIQAYRLLMTKDND